MSIQRTVSAAKLTPSGLSSAKGPFTRLMMKPISRGVIGFILVLDDGTRAFFYDGAWQRIDLPNEGGGEKNVEAKKMLS